MPKIPLLINYHEKSPLYESNIKVIKDQRPLFYFEFFSAMKQDVPGLRHLVPHREYP